MSLGSVGGTITTVVGLGVTLGALGLAFEFADRAIDRTSGNGKRRAKRRPLFDTGFGNSSGRSSRRSNGNNIFAIPGTKSKRTSRRKNNVLGGDFF